MMQVLVRGPYTRLMQVSRDVAVREGVRLFDDLRPTPSPRQWKLEIQVGDGIEAIAEADLRRYFASLATVAASG